MIALLIACLISAPSDCSSHEIPLYEIMPQMQMMEAQCRAADWLKEHPGLRMRGLSVVRGRAA
jgi:hypothetical protein